MASKQRSVKGMNERQAKLRGTGANTKKPAIKGKPLKKPVSPKFTGVKKPVSPKFTGVKKPARTGNVVARAKNATRSRLEATSPSKVGGVVKNTPKSRLTPTSPKKVGGVVGKSRFTPTSPTKTGGTVQGPKLRVSLKKPLRGSVVKGRSVRSK